MKDIYSQIMKYKEAHRVDSVKELLKEKYPYQGKNYSYFGIQIEYSGTDATWVKSFQKEEALCKNYLSGKISFIELITNLNNRLTLLTLILNLEYLN